MYRVQGVGFRVSDISGPCTWESIGQWLTIYWGLNNWGHLIAGDAQISTIVGLVDGPDRMDHVCGGSKGRREVLLTQNR